jgi:hypothetical protein
LAALAGACSDAPAPADISSAVSKASGFKRQQGKGKADGVWVMVQAPRLISAHHAPNLMPCSDQR